MATFDWIVVGNGIAGAALGYELEKAGFSVLILDSSQTGATRYSYGGIAYWSGTTELMRQICQESIEQHRQLSAELDGDTQFRELDLLLTVAPDRDVEQVAANYAQMEILPTVLTPKAACEVEPLLDPAAIAGALRFPYAQVSPEATVAAYNRAFLRLGGKIQPGTVTGLMQQGQQVHGVVTSDTVYATANIAICTGALTRSLLKSVGLTTRVYFTQAEIIETDPVDLRLNSLVMPADLQRTSLETQAGTAEADRLWDEPGHEVAPPILDAGVVQFRDGRFRIGQWSRACTDLQPDIDQTDSEAALRQSVGGLLPALKTIPGRWCRCQVAFSGDRLPLVGLLPDATGIHLFAGFSNPFAILPPLARRFAQTATGQEDPILAQLSPLRFVNSVGAG